MTSDIDLELLRELHPDSEMPSVTARQRARAALMLELELASESRPDQRPTRKRRRPFLVPTIGLLGVLGAITLALVIAGGLRGGVAQPATASAAELLQRAAVAAEASGGPLRLHRGEYWYVHSRDTTLGVAIAGRRPHRAVPIVDALGSLDRQIWIGLDRPSQLETHVIGPIRFLSNRARQQWERAGRPAQLNGPGDISLPQNAFDIPYPKLLRLPTNVTALRRLLARNLGKRSSAWARHELFTIIGDLLREDPVPAEVRAALYRVAATIPGIQMLGLTHDGIGRPALAVALNDPFDHERDELLFDPHTAKLLGESQVVLQPNAGFHVKPGTLLFESTYLSSGIVTHIPASALSPSPTAEATPVQIGHPRR